MPDLPAGNESAIVLAELVRRRKITAKDAVEKSLAQISAFNSRFNAFREICEAEAMDTADRIDLRIESGEDVGPLAGVPIAVKDNIATIEGRTCCGSRMLDTYRSPYASSAVRRLTAAGAIVIGKTNCDEFAMGSTSEHCAFGVVRNPRSEAHVPGGSSGGSAAAVAAELCSAALGSDTGGSIRQPAAFCGVVGVKPTYGRVSRSGLVAFASSLDQIGPLTRNVRDAALILQTMSGVDQLDATSSNETVPDYLDNIETAIEDLRIGVAREYMDERVHELVRTRIDHAIMVFREMGATIVEVDLALTRYGVATYYLLSSAEASSNLARFDGIRFGRCVDDSHDQSLAAMYARNRSGGLGVEVQRRIMLGTYALSAGYYDEYYQRAVQARRMVKDEYDKAFSRCHAIVGPVAPTPAFKIGSLKDDPLSVYLNDAFTVNANVAGICAMSVPCGVATSGDSRLPVGLHIQCQAFHEPTMFRIARSFERWSTDIFQK